MSTKVILLFIICYVILRGKAQTIEYLDAPIHSTNISFTNPIQFSKGKGDTALSAIIFEGGYFKEERTPNQPYKIVHLNLMTGEYDIIPVIKGNNPNLPQTSMGKFWSSLFAKNRKLYFCTTDPGNIVEFNPLNNHIRDLGCVLKDNNENCLNTYTLKTGMDSALYGGSFSYNKYLVTFRYDADADSFYTHKDIPIEVGENNYVTDITGNKDFTYVVVGKEHYKLYALHRSTNTVTLLRDRTDGGSIHLRYTADSVYFYEWHNALYKSWVINATLINPREDNNYYYPSSSHLFTSDFSPIPYDTLNYPEIIWDQDDKKALWRFSNDTSTVKQRNIPEIYSQIRTIATIHSITSNIMIGFGKFYSRVFNYNPATNLFNLLPGSTESLYSSIVHNNCIYYGSYGGNIFRYNPDSISTTSISFTPILPSQSNANPKIIVSLRNPNEGLGPAIIQSIGFINDTLGIFCGPVDSDGTRKGQGSSIGIFSTSGYKKYCTDSLLNYTFITGGVLGYNNGFYCISKDDNNEVFIYKYNYETNTIKKLFPSLFSGNTGKLTRGVYNQLVGWRNSEVHGHSLLYFLSEISDEIYKIIDIKSNLLSIKMGYDNMLWGLGLEEDNTFAFYKINPYNGEYTLVYSFQKPANSNDYSDFTFDGGTVYIVGSQQLARISNLTVPVLNSNLSTFEKLNKLFNFNTCD